MTIFNLLVAIYIILMIIVTGFIIRLLYKISKVQQQIDELDEHDPYRDIKDF